jgi:SAM-dependent methyltransferase
MDAEHLDANRAYWDESADLHRVSYDSDRLVRDPGALSSIVDRDYGLLRPFLPGGTVAGLDLVHLQCHIGTDTLSWARLGARVTGLDMSARSLAIARELASSAGIQADYIEATIAEGAAALAGRSFDVVYTSIGVLAWLDDLDVWARLISGLLRPGGVFFIREGHPIACALDTDAPVGELRLAWPYFDAGPIMDESVDDYSSSVPHEHPRTYEWAHSLGDVLGALLHAGLRIVDFQEHRDLPWRQLSWLEPDGNSFRLPEPQRDLCPLSFSLVASKPE